MIIVQLSGGLGNQLFQYAAGKSLAAHHGVPLLLDPSLFHRTVLPELELPRKLELIHFPAIDDVVMEPGQIEKMPVFRKGNNIFQKILPRYKRSIYKEPFFHFDTNFFNAGKEVMLKGTWQSPKYFELIAPMIREKFVLKNELTSRVHDKGLALRAEESVAVHIRRNDYLRMQIILEWHGVMDKDYYARGLEHLKQQHSNLKIYYFTDDPEWVSAELIPLFGGELISSETSKTHFEDFYLMSRCRHNIIANSSFSWWSAWLNDYAGKTVVTPKNWFRNGPSDTQDLYPANWVIV